MVHVARAVVPVTWRLDPALFERVQAAARARGISVQAFASEALANAVGGGEASPEGNGLSAEDRAWLDPDLSRLSEFEAYDWGPEGVPAGQPIRFVPGRGFVVETETPRG